MPYNKEFATNRGNQGLMASSGIKEMLKVVQFIISDSEFERVDNFVISERVKADYEKIKHIFVIDGSKQETTMTEGSHAKLCLFNINQCVIDMKKMMEYLKEQFPLPKQYKEIKDDVIFNFFLPMKGMRTAEHVEEREFFRASLYENLKRLSNPIVKWMNENNYKSDHQETILDTYMYLLGKMDMIKNVPHPCPTCRIAGRMMSVKTFKSEDGSWLENTKCRCNVNSQIMYPTDLLGFHEQLNNENSNEALTTQIMLVIERITLMNMIRNVIYNDHIELIKKSVFMIDGALAVYSHASWLSEAINKELMDIKHRYPILILGVEKTGNFVDHLKKIDIHFANEPLKNGMVFFLEDNYIKDHIKVYDNDSFYGKNNYFGKKMFYKNKLGKLFVINVAFENEADRVIDLNERNTKEYRNKITRLEDIIMLLDNFSSQSYENALSLISLANEGAALSSSYIGKKLLKEYVTDMLNT